ncbi:MAG TPA: hypothetical protein VF796_30470 [Humisphaera sp.]
MGIHDRDYTRKGRRDDDDEFVDRDDDAEAYEPEGDDDDDDDHADAGLHPEGPSRADIGDEDEPDLVRCPNCRRMIQADAERCPKCGHYVIDEELDRANRPWWVWVGIVLAAILALMYAVR